MLVSRKNSRTKICSPALNKNYKDMEEYYRYRGFNLIEVHELLGNLGFKYTTYKNLNIKVNKSEKSKALLSINTFNDKNFINWKKKWEKRLLKNNSTHQKSFELMRKHNPLVIPRNHKIEETLKAAEKGDFKPTNKILKVLENPYSEQKEMADFQSPSISKEKYQTFCGT